MHTPRLSIGVPVYNGARFLRATLDSILAQTWTDFELIICDNCSTDATESICREYAAKDPRVRYFRNERNLGPAPNYNRCFQYARGELFKWNAADDCIEPTFVQRCIELLDSDPSIVCAHTKTILIDDQGRPYRKYDHELDLDHPSPVVRFARLVFVNHRKHNAHEFWGVVRAEALRKTPMKGSFPSADRILMSFWALQGRIARVEEYLFLNREHPQRSQRAIANRDFRPGSALSRWIGGGPTPPYEWWDPRLKGRIVFPEWRWVWEYLRAVRMTKLPLRHKLGCYAVMAALYVAFLPRLARDVLIAGEQLLRRLLSCRGAAPISDTGGPGCEPRACDPPRKRAA
ncbi:glycosyltransferase family 2 protein [Fontivita pretiosa]|uniref:glycosyltransferase family 2 protein n=1 Tax=Fontivita pretiosa TaxID=2989684 RepID=UPI003D185733